MKQKIYLCRHCGNVIPMLRDRGVPVYCCGEKMREVKPETAQVPGEKHVPVCRTEGNVVHVTVGAVEHPMAEEHHIEWICLETEQVVQYAYLRPKDRPEARFALCDGDEVRSAGAFCNQHQLWRN